MAIVPNNKTEKKEELRREQPAEGRNREQKEAPVRLGSTRLITREVNGERVSKFLTTAKEILEVRFGKDYEVTKRTAVRAVRADEGEEVVVVVRELGEDTYFHTFLFEDSTKSVVERRSDNHQRRDRSRSLADHLSLDKCYTTVADDLDKMFADAVIAATREAVTFQGVLLSSGITVVPFEVKVEDQTIVDAYMIYADDANCLADNRDVPFDHTVIGAANELTGDIDFIQRDSKTLEGMPIRSDFTIRVVEQPTGRQRSRQRTRDNHPLLGNREHKTHVTVNGYVDAVYVGCKKGETQGYAPRILGTHFDTFDHKGNNFEMLFLGIATLPYLTTNYAWQQCFAPNIGDDAAFRNLGAFGYDIELAGPGTGFKPLSKVPNDNWEELMSMVFVPDEEDMIQVGALIRNNMIGYATMSILVDIANGDHQSFEIAVQAIDEMTDGHFGDLFTGTRCEDIIESSIRKPCGYYTAGGKMLPSEHLDTLAFLNRLGSTGTEEISIWHELNSHMSDRLTSEQQEAGLMNRYNELSMNTFVAKGFATEVVFAPHFITSLFNSVVKSELRLTADLDSGNIRERIRRRGRSQHGGIGASLTRRAPTDSHRRYHQESRGSRRDRR